MLNTAVLKSIGFWIGLVSAILGVLVSQHVIIDGSTVGNVIGWLMTLIGSAGVGHQVAAAPKTDTI